MSTVGIPKTGAYVEGGRPSPEPQYIQDVRKQVQAEAAPYMQTQQPTQPPQAPVGQQPTTQKTPEQLDNELRAFSKADDLLKMANRDNPDVDNTTDHDDEPHGYDTSDKLGMLGSLFVTGGAGIAEAGARAVQLAGDLAEKFPALSGVLPGKTKAFTDWFNREEERNNLLREAYANHPIVGEIGNVLGSVAAQIPLGEGIIGVGGKALGALGEVAPEALKATFGLIKGATGRGAAKAILNSKYMSGALKLSKLAGKGAVIGEMQYDPYNNNILNQGVSGALWTMALGKGASLLKNIAPHAKNAIMDIAEKHGISLPIRSAWEKAAAFLPLSGYNKMIQERAGKVIGEAEKISTPIIERGKSEILSDLDSREAVIKDQLKQPGLEDYQTNKLNEQLKDISSTREEVGDVHGYDKYMSGKLAQSLNITENKYAKMIDQVKKNIGEDTFVETPTSKKIAEQVFNEQKDKLDSLRQNRVSKIASDLFADNDLSKIFQQSGIKNPEEFTNIVNGMIKGNISTAQNKIIAPYAKDIMNVLGREGYTQTKDFSNPIYKLMNTSRFTFQSLKDNMGLIRERAQNAATDVDSRDLWRIHSAMRSDIRNMVVQHGDKNTLDLFDKAQKMYQDRAAPFKKPPYADYRSAGANADGFIGKFFKPEGVDTAKYILKLMPEGEQKAQMALKAGVMQEAWNRAYVPGSGLNPVKWINEVQRLGETNKVIFSKAENEAFNGYKELVGVMESVSKDALRTGMAIGLPVAEAAPGSKLWKARHIISNLALTLGLTGSAVGHGVITLPILLGAVGFGRLMTTDGGRKILIQLSKLGEKASAEKLSPVINSAYKLMLYGGAQPAVTLGRGM